LNTISFLGYSGAGKTTSLCVTAKALLDRGLKVGAVKHIHKGGFTVDTVGKDTWKYGNAGISMVVSIAPEEIAIIQRRETSALSLKKIRPLFEKERLDYVLVEGWHGKVGKNLKDLKTVICVASFKEAKELIRLYPNAVCVLAKTKLTQVQVRKYSKKIKKRQIPILHIPEDNLQLFRILIR
jgi:molybdopterin-guanine dinucleotide biosynthesis protein MobB